MVSILAFIEAYGYASVFFFTLLEGEVVVALAGFLASEGVLELRYVIMAAILGAILGDHAYFFFGRYKGTQFLQRHPSFALRAQKIHRLIEYHQNWLIFGSRFMYGFRTILPIAIGTSGVRFARFFFLNVLGSVAWGLFFSVGGYIFGNAAEQFIGKVIHAEKFIVIGVIIGVVLVQGILFLRRRVISGIERAEARLEERER